MNNSDGRLCFETYGYWRPDGSGRTPRHSTLDYQIVSSRVAIRGVSLCEARVRDVGRRQGEMVERGAVMCPHGAPPPLALGNS